MKRLYWFFVMLISEIPEIWYQSQYYGSKELTDIEDFEDYQRKNK